MPQQVNNATLKSTIGWFLILIVPLAIYFYMSHSGGQYQTTAFLSIISISLIMWIFELLPDFIPGLFAILMLLLFDIAPQEIVMSGFSSSSLFLALSVLGLGAVITSSGLSYRYSLMMLKVLPANTFWYSLGLFFTGILFTPLVPAIIGRASIVGPILTEIVSNCDKNGKKQASTMLFSSSFNGITFLSATFLTSTPLNFIIFSMLPAQEQSDFNFLYWFYASSVVFFVMIVLYVLVSSIYYRSYVNIDLSKKIVEKKLEELGGLTKNEWAAIIGIILLGIGLLTTTVHKIDIPWVAFSILFLLLFFQAISRDDFRRQIDWSFLLLLGSTVGVVATMNHLGLDEDMAKQLAWLGSYMVNDFQMFVILLTITIIGIRFFVPMNTTILIFAATLIPLASSAGMNAWLIGFLILLIAETSIFPYQAPFFLYFKQITQDNIEYDERKVYIFHVILISVKLIAVYISIAYFWDGYLLFTE